MDFSTLKARLLAEIGRAPSDLTYELVTADINQEMRLRSMESTTTLTAALSINLPDDFVSVVEVYVDASPRRSLSQLEPQALQRLYTDGTCPPKFYAIVNDTMQLDGAASSEDIQLRYIAKLSDLSADSDTNVVLTNHPAVYIYGVLAHHAALKRDAEGASVWAAAYQAEMKKAMASDRKKGGPPSAPIPRAVA